MILSLVNVCWSFLYNIQGMGHGDVDLCQPIVLRVTAKEVVTNNEVRSIKSTYDDKSEVDIAIIIDDVINREPRFLQKQ